MTPEQLSRATGATLLRAGLYLGPLEAGMAFYAIDTPPRRSAFLAQVGHETGGLRWVREIWGPTPQQERYSRDFGEPWPTTDAEARLPKFERNRLAYRLGNAWPGDGERYPGHGLIQTTGRANHRRVTERLRTRFDNVPDFEEEPDRLCEPKWAALSACDFWDREGLNTLADAGDFRAMTKRINGGFNGYEDRVARWEIAKGVFA